MKTVGDCIRRLQEFPEDWPVQVATQAGGGITIAHREVKGKPIIAIFGSNGGQLGENPLTEQEYKAQSEKFMWMWRDAEYLYTSAHGDHRMFRKSGGVNATCYGTHFDPRVIERMVVEGLIPQEQVDIDRVRRVEGFTK